MAYRLLGNGVLRVEDGTEIPFVDGNADYEAYKLWLAAGNTPDPMLPVDLLTPVWEEFRIRRELYLGRLSDIAGRYSRKSVPAVAAAADAISEGLLAMPQSTALQDPSIDSPDALRTAIVVAANQLLRAQLTDPTTAPAIKAALDQVFKKP